MTAVALSGPCQALPEPLAIARFARHLLHSEGPRQRGHRTPATNAPVAQLDRAPDYESGGQEFESLRARQLRTNPSTQLSGPRDRSFLDTAQPAVVVLSSVLGQRTLG